jgi:hypothetical protein
MQRRRNSLRSAHVRNLVGCALAVARVWQLRIRVRPDRTVTELNLDAASTVQPRPGKTSLIAVAIFVSSVAR